MGGCRQGRLFKFTLNVKLKYTINQSRVHARKLTASFLLEALRLIDSRWTAVCGIDAAY